MDSDKHLLASVFSGIVFFLFFVKKGAWEELKMAAILSGE